MASRSVGESARLGYESFDAEITSARREAAVLAGDPIDRRTFAGITEENERLETRVKILKGLVNYAEALEALASKDVKSDIESNSKLVVENLTSLSATVKDATGSELPLSDEGLQVIGTAFKVAADGYVLVKRKRAIREIVIAADPSIQRVASLIASETKGLGWVAYSSLRASQQKLSRAYERNAQSLTYTERLSVAAKIEKLERQIPATQKVYSDIAKAAAKMGEAHAALLQSVQTRKFMSEEFIADVRDLVAYAQETRKFADSLGKTSD